MNVLQFPLPSGGRSPRVRQNRYAWGTVLGAAAANTALLFAQSSITRPFAKMFTASVLFVSLFAMIATFSVAVCLAHECDRYWPGVAVAVAGFYPTYLLATLVLIPGLFFRAASVFFYHFPALILLATFLCLGCRLPKPKSRKSLPSSATVHAVSGKRQQPGRRVA